MQQVPSIKLTLSQEEYDSIVELSDRLDRPLAGTVKEIIRFAALSGKLASDVLQKAEKEVENDLINNLLNQKAKEDYVTYYRVSLFCLQLKKFSKSWNAPNVFIEKNSFVKK